MKMNKSLIALCLSAGLLASAPGISLADVNYVPQNTSDAPAIPSAALQQLTWTPSINLNPDYSTVDRRPTTERFRHQWSGCCVQRPGKHW